MFWVCYDIWDALYALSKFLKGSFYYSGPQEGLKISDSISVVSNVCIRWVSVVEFHDGALGTGKVFGQESTVVKWNYQILSLHLVIVCQKVPMLDFQSEFSMSKIIQIFLKKNLLKNINLGAPFL